MRFTHTKRKVSVWGHFPAGLLVAACCGTAWGQCPAPGPEDEYVSIGTGDVGLPYDMEVHTGGYMDIWIWGDTTCHDHSSHEMLSGEWAAAIWYDGIPHGTNPPTDPASAVWLPKKFIYPDWSTNSSFNEVLTTVSSDPNNPFPGVDTYQGIITNGEIQVRIDVELVDLGGCWPHPMGLAPASLDQDYVGATAYMSLWTYTITNLSGRTLDDIEFYQMLSSHPAGSEGAAVMSVYDPTDHQMASTDQLETYTPYNPVHTIGNFRYDITQWNVDGEGDTPPSGHTDLAGFSATIAPDAYDNWLYEGTFSSSKPSRGLHLSIEARDLSAARNVFGPEEIAGAMMWNMPTLLNGESTSITLALMNSSKKPMLYGDCDGDADGDKHVGQTDLGLVLANYGTTVPQNTNGDVDGDGWVGQSDLGIVTSNYGYVCFP